MGKVIDEIKEITAVAVSKKQDAAKLNFPKIMEHIKAAAANGHSECRIDSLQMNEYDRRLLQEEGFNVSLVDKARGDYEEHYILLGQFISSKEWVIRW